MEESGDAAEQDPRDGEEPQPEHRVGAAPGVVAEEGAAAARRPGRGVGAAAAAGEERAQEGVRHGGGAGGDHGRELELRL